MSKRKERRTYAQRKLYFTQRYHTRRTAALRQLGGTCAECGTTDELTFDHIDTDVRNVYQIGALFMWGAEERIETELGLCQLLCRSCHGRKTRLETA